MQQSSQSTRAISATVLALVIVSSSVWVHLEATQNIRIQVNNENLQSPPYLLEAIKQAALADSIISTGGSRHINTNYSTSQVASASATAPNPFIGRNQTANSPVREEAIEELLDLEPESVLRLAPQSFMNVVSQEDLNKLNNNRVQSPPVGHQKHTLLDSTYNDKPSYKPQLPVTSSHLKRPPIGLSSELADEQTNDGSQAADSGRAKSRVSPSVAMSDEPPAAANELDKKAAQPPDTWEPSQIMNGVANVSMVPATVTRVYGHHSRTRITLGGGYVREKAPAVAMDGETGDEYPPMVEAASEDKPVKILAPTGLHRTNTRPQVNQSPLRPERSKNDNGGDDSSRIIEVPERIVVSTSMFSKPEQQQQQQSAGSSQPMRNNEQPTKRPQMSIGKPDPRCPGGPGRASFEHPSACDKYFVCEDGYMSEHTCPNGLMYGTRDTVTEFCIHRWRAVCGDKSIPNPISSPGCRWQYGIFNVQGSPKCVPDYYECTDGVFEVKKCPLGGQVYDDRTKSCQYAEQVGCVEEALADFHCPPDDQANTYWPFPRYFLNDRSIIHCINDKPQIIRCAEGERVDAEHLHCVLVKKQEDSAILSSRSAAKERGKKMP